MSSTTFPYSTAIKPTAALITALLVSGCGSIIPHKGPLHIEPAKHVTVGYHQTEKASIFESEEIKISVSPINAADGDTGFPIINDLLTKDYVVFEMEIENGSGERVIYNPNHTSLMSNVMDYNKPLDYTDLFDIVMHGDDWIAAQKELRELKGRFYDLNTKLEPRRGVSKFILFRPIDKSATQVVLVIKELYFGTKTISVDFIFKVRGEGDDDAK
ncbi:MAG: hypothetical protein V3W31_08115 [Thermodesulfobacteriota bacterium]